MHFYHLIYYYLYHYFNHDFIDNHNNANNIRPCFSIGIVGWLYVIVFLHWIIWINGYNPTGNVFLYIDAVLGIIIIISNELYFTHDKKYIKIYEIYSKYKERKSLKILCVIFLTFPIVILFPIMVTIFR